MNLLSSLNDDEFNRLIKCAAIERIPPSTKLYTDGQPLNDTFCVLVAGILEVRIGASRVATMSAGFPFGESAYFLERRRTATVSTTSEPAVVLKFTLSAEQLERSFPDLYRKLLASALGTAAKDAQGVVGKAHRPNP
jgi:CRP-like cAMP-binding protein